MFLGLYRLTFFKVFRFCLAKNSTQDGHKIYIQLVAFMSYLEGRIGRQNIKKVTVLLVLLVLAIGIFLFSALTSAGYIQSWNGRFYSLWDTGYAIIHLPLIASVSEHQPTSYSMYFNDLSCLSLFGAGRVPKIKTFYKIIQKYIIFFLEFWHSWYLVLFQKVERRLSIFGDICHVFCIFFWHYGTPYVDFIACVVHTSFYCNSRDYQSNILS